ncbi:MAG: DUF3800 domain-containing protein [Myxococcota bacterium]
MELAAEPKVFSWMGTGGVVADSELVFYADESGNTFANHLDAAQPYYVTGGWLLRAADVPLAQAIVAGILASTDLDELKGSRLMKTTRGQRAAGELVPRLLRFATPILVVIEKKYALGARLFDDFVMYPGGPFFPAWPDREVGRKFATIFATLPDEALSHANNFLTERAPETAKACAAVIEQALRAAGHEDVAEVVRRSTAAPSAWWTGSEIIKRSGSPNVTGYNTLLQMLELLALACAQHISLVHDELHQLAPVYDFYQNHASRADLSQSEEFFQKAGCPGRVAHVSPPKFVTSHSEPLIQAADVLCSVATSFLSRRSLASRPYTNEARDLALLALWGFVEPDLSDYFAFIGLADAGMRIGQSLVDLFSSHPLYEVSD